MPRSPQTGGALFLLGGPGLPCSQSTAPSLALGLLLARSSLGAAIRHHSRLQSRQAPCLSDQAFDTHEPLAHLVDVVHHE